MASTLHQMVARVASPACRTFASSSSSGAPAMACRSVPATRAAARSQGMPPLSRRGIVSSARQKAADGPRASAGNHVHDATPQSAVFSLRNNPSGKVVIYRGPSPKKPWVDRLTGFVFIGCGIQLAVTIYDHLSWPLFSSDPDRQPELVAFPIRRAVAGLAATVGLVTSYMFFINPTKNIVRLTLDLHNRELIMRTASREFSALLPRVLYPKPLRRVAERKGWYRTSHPRERVVPLSSVYRVRGSALQSSYTAQHQIRSVGVNKGKTNTADDTSYDANLLVSPNRSSIEIRSGSQRMWYTLEASGGAMREMAPRKGFAGVAYGVSELLRGKTDWSNDDDVASAQPSAATAVSAEAQQNSAPMTTPLTREQEARSILGPKQPWFADRRTFDDIIPRITRKQ